jgi:hypothetical protein
MVMPTDDADAFRHASVIGAFGEGHHLLPGSRCGALKPLPAEVRSWLTRVDAVIPEADEGSRNSS